jgi:hypothetical protein
MRTDHGFYGKGLCSCAGAVPEIIIKTAAVLIQTQRIYPRIYIYVLHTRANLRAAGAGQKSMQGKASKRLQRRQVELWSRGGKWPRVKQNRGNDWGVGRKAGGGASLYR